MNMFGINELVDIQALTTGVSDAINSPGLLIPMALIDYAQTMVPVNLGGALGGEGSRFVNSAINGFFSVWRWKTVANHLRKT